MQFNFIFKDEYFVQTNEQKINLRLYVIFALFRSMKDLILVTDHLNVKPLVVVRHLPQVMV